MDNVTTVLCLIFTLGFKSHHMLIKWCHKAAIAAEVHFGVDVPLLTKITCATVIKDETEVKTLKERHFY